MFSVAAICVFYLLLMLDLIPLFSDSCGEKMQVLQSLDIIDALMYLWKLRLTKLLQNMIIPQLPSRFFYLFKGIDFQIEFYKQEGLTPYSEVKLPFTSGKNLFIDRFTGYC
ncbi:hypothetical protein Ancab_002316 [Ancistrocladus abbreviatus]